MMDIKDNLKEVIGGILEFADNESIETFQKVAEIEGIKKSIQSAKSGNQEDFFFDIIYPLENFIDGLLSSVTNNDDAQFILKNGQFIERHFLKLIDKYEGFGCSADKSRTIMRVLLSFFMKGKEIEFNYDQEITYHLPKTIFTRHDDIVDFYNAVKSLYWGNAEPYLHSLKNVIDSAELVVSKQQGKK